MSLDTLERGASYAEDAGVTFPSAFDGDGEVLSSLGLNNLPYSLLIGC
ncbi:Redoxin domain protein (fragment) [Modestobacter italicus]|uniref:Redoxin domain protein n=1 Tax=Modestobacter italicus (strain DSM 44449 / CECT 9708 / BC 501) TaxID=2732864 RepID=I4F0K2_MODI5